ADHGQELLDLVVAEAQAHAGIARPDHHLGNAGHADGEAAHGARLHRGVEDAVGERTLTRAVAGIHDAEPRGEAPQHHRLRVGGHVEGGNRLVVPAREDLATAHDDAAHRHVALGEAGARFFQRDPHEPLVLGIHVASPPGPTTNVRAATLFARPPLYCKTCLARDRWGGVGGGAATLPPLTSTDRWGGVGGGAATAP